MEGMPHARDHRAPQWTCRICSRRMVITGVEALRQPSQSAGGLKGARHKSDFAIAPSSGHTDLHKPHSGASKMDESFVVLPGSAASLYAPSSSALRDRSASSPGFPGTAAASGPLRGGGPPSWTGGPQDSAVPPFTGEKERAPADVRSRSPRQDPFDLPFASALRLDEEEEEEGAASPLPDLAGKPLAMALEDSAGVSGSPTHADALSSAVRGNPSGGGWVSAAQAAVPRDAAGSPVRAAEEGFWGEEGAGLAEEGQQQEEEEQEEEEREQQQQEQEENEQAQPEEQEEAGSLSREVQLLQRVWAVVEGETEVPLPLCCECLERVCRQAATHMDSLQRDIAAYEAALAQLQEEGEGEGEEEFEEEGEREEEGEGKREAARVGEEEELAGEYAAFLDRNRGSAAAAAPLPASSFHGMGSSSARQERADGGTAAAPSAPLAAEEAELQALLLARRQVQQEMREAEEERRDLEREEERYWRDFNAFQEQLAAHHRLREALLSSIQVAAVQRAALERSFALNDAFRIASDGAFCTINNLRLGRLPAVPVEWDEINAAWGQAAQLLHTLATLANCTLRYQVIPMGSFARIADGPNQYDLFGPVNLFFSTRYDRAMVLFLACVKEFADFAHEQDHANKVPEEKRFQLPYKIQGDKVNGLTVKQSFNKEEKWTLALKYLLCNLKMELVWTQNNFNPPQSCPPSVMHNITSNLFLPEIVE